MAGKVAGTKETSPQANAAVKLWAGELKSLKNQQKAKITPEVVDKLCDLIRGSNRVITACEAVGITRETYYNHLRHAKEGQALIDNGADIDDLEPRHQRGLTLRNRIREALAIGETEDIQTVKDMPNNWTARAWLLERRCSAWRRGNPIAAPEGVENDLVLPEDRGEDQGPQFGFMLPVALPEDVYVQMVNAMRAQGSMPGEHTKAHPHPEQQSPKPG